MRSRSWSRVVDAFRVRHEKLQHSVLGRAEGHRAIADHHPMARLIQGEAIELNHLVDAIDGGASQYRVDAGEELAR